MCCPLDQVQGKLDITVSVKNNTYHAKGVYDCGPKTLTDRIFRTFQRMELIEKMAEIVDESFHLLGSTFQRYANTNLYEIFRDMHHASHNIEHLLHATCFLSDLFRMVTGRFLEYGDHEKKKIDYLRTASRVFQATGHFLATIDYLTERQLVKPNRLTPLTAYLSLFSATGYSLWLISLIWRRHQGKANDRFSSDVAIHLGGFLFEALPLTKKMASFASFGSVINKMTAVAGIVQAGCVVDRLMPQDRVVVKAHGTLSDQPLKEHSHKAGECHHH